MIRMKKTMLMVSVILLLALSVGCDQSKKVEENIAVTDFAVRLLQCTYDEEENVLVSPISVLSDLSELANNTDGDALTQIEETVGMTSEELNKYIRDYTNYLSRINNRKTKAQIEVSETNQSNDVYFEGVWDHAFGGGSERMVDRVDYYLKGECVTGFVKQFKNEKYALAILLPKGFMDLDGYVQYLTGEKLYSILNNPIEEETDIYIPQLSVSYEVDMKSILPDMGITNIFDEEDTSFSEVGQVVDSEEVQFNNFFYKTSIDMDVNGINTERTAKVPPDIATYEANPVEIDRPFLIIIMDCKYNIPLLIGTVVNV